MPVPLSPTSASAFGSSLHTVPYESTIAGKPPINITVAPPPPSSARLGIHPLLRPSTSPEPSLTSNTSYFAPRHDPRRDSGLAPSGSTARESRTTLTDVESTASVPTSPSLLRVPPKTGPQPFPVNRFRKWSGHKTPKDKSQGQLEGASEAPTMRITTDIPSISFDDLTSPGKVEFSKRGSMLIGGKRANDANARANGHSRAANRGLQPTKSATSATSTTPIRVLSADDEMLSQKVRSMYEVGTDQDLSSFQNRLSNNAVDIEEEAINGEEFCESSSNHRAHNVAPTHDSSETTPSCTNRRESFIQREERELAGGIEDWQDIRGEDVDRYGFIMPKALTLPNDLTDSLRPTSPQPPRIHRVSTLLQLASEAPRNQRSKLGRTPSAHKSTHSSNTSNGRQTREIRPRSSQGSYRSTASRPASRMRSATNRLPHNQERRYIDEAGDMLTLPPGLADIAEHGESRATAENLKKKEWEREEKWRKMARLAKSDQYGGGMIFDFDTRDPKLVQRTWKGIPDRWRATAWHAFLSASARKTSGSSSDEELISVFNELLDQSSPDDVQIDIDVPRTINSHIMFRRRYRGGQRLLFRVLHCLSIYFPETGYVQGMATLAATLLCYFDEEMAFVMLVRMWQLRGLALLYQPGFDGLMEALDEFEKKWLIGGSVAAKLVSPCKFI